MACSSQLYDLSPHFKRESITISQKHVPSCRTSDLFCQYSAETIRAAGAKRSQSPLLSGKQSIFHRTCRVQHLTESNQWDRKHTLIDREDRHLIIIVGKRDRRLSNSLLTSAHGSAPVRLRKLSLFRLVHSHELLPHHRTHILVGALFVR